MPATFAPSQTRSLLPWIPAIASAIRLRPIVDSNYGPAYLLFDYRHGFVKRGLLGVPFHSVHRLARWEYIAFELLVLTLAVLTTYLVFREPIFDERLSMLTVVLLAGPGMLPHLSGLFIPTDPLQYVAIALSAWALLRLPQHSAWGLTLLVCGTTLLIHEAFVLMFYPLVVAILFDQCRRGRMRLAVGVAHLAVMAVGFALVMYLGKLKISPEVFQAEAIQRASFHLDTQLFRLMHMTPQRQRQELVMVLNRQSLALLVPSLLLCIPYHLVLIGAVRRGLQAAKAVRWQTVVVFAVLCAPLLTCLIAADYLRWLSDVCICMSLFVLYLYCADDSDGAVRESLRHYAANPRMAFVMAYSVLLGPYVTTFLDSVNDIVFDAHWRG